MIHPTDHATRVRAALDASETTPAPDTLATAPLLDPWQVAVSSRARVAILLGIVTGHPRLPDGPVETSVLLALDPQGRWARTLSRWYRLGTPYTEAMPSAEHRTRLREELGSG